jgi:hypothetical protein
MWALWQMASTPESKFTVAPLTNPVPKIVNELKSPFMPTNPMFGERRVKESGEGGGTGFTVKDAELLMTFAAYAVMYAVPVASPVAIPVAASIPATE